MPVKRNKPITPGSRFRVQVDFGEITTNKPEKSLVRTLKGTGGRNNSGKMTVRHQGGGHKRKLRIIDWKRDKSDIPAIVKSIEYDPSRSARIALLHYKDGEKSYIIAPDKLKVGAEVISGSDVPPETGNAMPLQAMPLGAIVHNIELQPGKGAALARSAGSYARLISKEEKYVVLRLPSRERRKILGSCIASIGAVSNPEHIKQRAGKAGRNRWLGSRPRVRGVAMNPVDHPMGGGSGGKATGGHPRSRKGLCAKGKKTRNRKKKSTQYILK